jgi:hypothetical protein
MAKALLWHLRYQNSFYQIATAIHKRFCCLYAMRKSSKVTALYPGSFTSGDMLAVLFVGPMEPATKRGLSDLVVNYQATSRANFADS